MKNVCEFRII